MKVMTVSTHDEVSSTLKEGLHVNGHVNNTIKTLTEEEAKAEEKLVKESRDEPLLPKAKWYLIDTHWYDQWKQYINALRFSADAASQYPGPVDNGPLFTSGERSNKLREHLYEGSQYYLISEKGWNRLYESYGLKDGQEPIERYVVEFGSYPNLKVEVYLIELKLFTFKTMDHGYTRTYSRVTILGDVMKDMKQLFSIPDDEEVRLWNQFAKGTYELITAKPSTTLQDSSISSGQMLVLERKENNEWTRQTRTRSLSSSSGMNLVSSPAESYESSRITSPSTFYRQKSISSRGLCGLNNLGNTCFMNSALQCLSNTTPLTKYFMSKTHLHELNPSNPLGMHGKIAEAYGDLIQQMWSGQNTSVSPRHFKMQVGRFAPSFSGYQQQDTHELLAFLLDGLHEDLNRVKQKPYIELQDDKGRPDEVVAAEAWKNHILRNDSVIVDLFHGQFKSTVECPVCDKKSITFDPFCYLSLPLPIKKERNLVVTFVPLDVTKKPMKIKVTVPKNGYTTDLTHAVAKLTGCDSKKCFQLLSLLYLAVLKVSKRNQLVVFDVFGSRFHKKYHEKEVLSHINDRDDIFVYEIPIDADKTQEEEILVIPVYLRKIGPSGYYSYTTTTLFGIPLLVTFPKASITATDMYQIILKSMRRYVTPPDNNLTLLQQSQQQVQENGLMDEEMPEERSESEEQSDDISNDDSDSESKIKNDAAEKEEDLSDDDDKSSSSSEEPKYLFDICTVSSSGGQEFRKLEYGEKPLQLKSSLYLAIDWSPKVQEKYYDSQLAMEVDEHESMSKINPPKKVTQLEDCLELFLQKEKLGEEDPWYCPVCKEHRQAYKKFDLWTLPKILIIHLKRFSYSRYYRDKLDALVNFPVNSLDLTDYVINKKHEPAVYDLHGVSNHYGGLGGGHYTAYAINSFDGQWHYFDDSSVSSADADSPVSKAAYVLFYTRRDDPNHEMMNTSELVTEDQEVFPNSEHYMDTK